MCSLLLYVNYISAKLFVFLKRNVTRGTWVAWSVEHLTSAQVVISLLMSLSPMSGSVLTAQGPDGASDSVSPPHSAPLLLEFCLSLSVSLSLSQK